MNFLRNGYTVASSVFLLARLLTRIEVHYLLHHHPSSSFSCLILSPVLALITLACGHECVILSAFDSPVLATRTFACACEYHMSACSLSTLECSAGALERRKEYGTRPLIVMTYLRQARCAFLYNLWEVCVSRAPHTLSAVHMNNHHQIVFLNRV